MRTRMSGSSSAMSTRMASPYARGMSTVLVSSPQTGVTQLTLNRPEKLNAMNVDLITELHAAFATVAADRSCRAVVLTGAGRGFCAGLDLGGYGTVPGAEGRG